MPLFDDSTITKFAEEAEKNYCVNHKLIIGRVSLEIISGSDELTLPAYIFDIRRITYKGYPLEPYGQTEYVESGTKPTAVTGSKPRFYIVNYKARNILRLLPTPNENVAVQVTSLWETSAIQAGFIIEYHRTPDFTTATERMPSWMRRQYVKNYVLQRCVGLEGKGNTEKVSAYFEEKNNNVIEEISIIKNNIISCVRYEMESNLLLNAPRKPGRPVLPTNFGVVIR